MTIFSEGWFADGQGMIDSSNPTKPVNGTEYKYVIALKSKTGYAFSCDSDGNYSGKVICDSQTIYNGLPVKAGVYALVTNQQDGSQIITIGGYPVVTATDGTSQDNYVINNVVINNTPTSWTVGEVPKAQATKGDNGAYTFYEYWEEWEQTENGLEPVKFWYSDAGQMSNVPAGKAITTFEEGKTYSYSIIATGNENYTFASKDTLSVTLNGSDFSAKSEPIMNGKSLMIGPGAFMKPVKPTTQKEIELIEINNATVSFQAGDKPVFTGTVANGTLYAIDYEGWFGANNEFISSSDYWNSSYVERGWCDGLISSFKANTEYTYQLYLKLTDEAVEQGYVFGSNTKLKVNGKDVNYPHMATGIVLQVGTDLTMTPTAAGASDYKIIEGANGTWMQNSDGTLTFRANGDFDKFTGVKVDGTLIDAKNYTAVSGSTVITLKADYLKTLSVGTHKLTVVYTDGECSTNFEIKATQAENSGGSESEKAPQTGDNSHLAFWLALLFVSGTGVLGTTVYGKKKRVR